jgi:hypothetical protein
MKKLVLIFYCLITQYSGYSQDDKALADKIINDHRLDTIMAKARALLSKGFNAGDGYPQVWIRDLNTFIETSLKVYNVDTIKKKPAHFFIPAAAQRRNC